LTEWCEVKRDDEIVFQFDCNGCYVGQLRFSQCELCFHFKQGLAAAKNLEEKLGILVEYRRHLADQYQDRTLLWTLQEAAVDDMSDVLVMQLDGMDQGKFRLPRDPGLRCTASVPLGCHSLLDTLGVFHVNVKS